MYSLTVLEMRSPKFVLLNQSQGVVPFPNQRSNHFSCLFQLPTLTPLLSSRPLPRITATSSFCCHGSLTTTKLTPPVPSYKNPSIPGRLAHFLHLQSVTGNQVLLMLGLSPVFQLICLT